MASLFSLLVLLPLVSAFPHRRSAKDCAQFGTITSYPYSLFANYWGESDAASGSQCATLDSVNGDGVAWSTEFSWTGGSKVKSFSNIQLDDGLNKQLSAISSMPTTWKWSYHSTGSIVADVAYDLFTSYFAGGPKAHEAMIWLADFNAKPISFHYDYDGKAIPIETNIRIACKYWNVYHGYNGYNAVYSFVPVTGNITDFHADIFKFFTYLIDQEFVPSSQYLIIAQAGIEVTYGTATFETSSYSLAIR